VGITLYRFSRNPALSIADLLTRSADGAVRQRPRVALDLHYLLTFRGTTEWDTQQLVPAAGEVQGCNPAQLSQDADVPVTLHLTHC
jgi:hypothetical protein